MLRFFNVFIIALMMINVGFGSELSKSIQLFIEDYSDLLSDLENTVKEYRGYGDCTEYEDSITGKVNDILINKFGETPSKIKQPELLMFLTLVKQEIDVVETECSSLWFGEDRPKNDKEKAVAKTKQSEILSMWSIRNILGRSAPTMDNIAKLSFYW